MAKRDVRDILAQFQNLNLEQVGSWPTAPRAAVWIGVVILALAAGWFFVWSNQMDQLDQLRADEARLKEEYRSKLQQAINLDELKRQREQVNQYVLTLEKQLPSKAEMDAYHDMSRKPESWTAEDIAHQRIRFCSIWQVIEEAELADEYEAWKEANPNA